MALNKQLKVLAKPYYWVNLILAFSYLISKKLPPICTRLFKHRGDEMCEFDSRETEILFFLLIIVMIRSRKTGSVTMVNYLSASFIYTKVANTILWGYSDYLYGVVFLVICIMVGLILPEPSYRGPEHITYFRNMQTFEEELARDKRITWLVCFYTVWNPSCVSFAPVYAELSAEYNLDNLKFGKIDIGRHSDIAQKFHISDSSFSRQLPTVILFENGVEVERRPCADAKGKLQRFFFSNDNVRAAFGLNMLYKKCVENPLKAIKQVTAAVKKAQ